MMKTIGLFLLLLLKIAGWMLGLLLLFLIAMLLFVLFVPVRYHVFIQNERSIKATQSNPAANLQLRLKAHWLLHLIHVTIHYGPDGLQNEIRVAGIDILKLQKRFAQKKENARQTISSKPDHTNDTVQQETNVSKQPEQPETNVPEQPVPIKEKDSGAFLEEDQTEAPSSETEEKTKEKTKKRNTNVKSKKSTQKATKQQPGLFQKIRSLMQRLHQEFTDEGNRYALSHLWTEALKILRSYKPKKLKADIAFSLANPALTGEVTGIISLLPFIYRYPCTITPDFVSENFYVEGEIQAHGKVTVFVFLKSLLRLLFDKKIKKVIRKVMKKE